MTLKLHLPMTPAGGPRYVLRHFAVTKKWVRIVKITELLRGQNNCYVRCDVNNRISCAPR